VERERGKNETHREKSLTSEGKKQRLRRASLLNLLREKGGLRLSVRDSAKGIGKRGSSSRGHKSGGKVAFQLKAAVRGQEKRV